MELQTLINTNKDYLNIIKSEGITVKTINKYNIALLKYNYDYTNFDKDWKKYCRGCIIDLLTNKLICIPPMKAFDINESTLNETPIVVQNLIDGTMINLFYHQNEWIISTRSSIGGYNKWNQTNFKVLFEESSQGLLNYNELDKGISYSFVLLNKKNRNVSAVKTNTILLVDAFDRTNCKYIDIYTIDGLNDICIESIKVSNINEYINTLKKETNNFNWKGITIKYKQKRYNYINPEYSYVDKLNVNSNNTLYRYLHLQRGKKLHIYLSYYPELTDLYNKYNSLLSILRNELHSNYSKYFIIRDIKLKDIPFQLKPLLFELHNEYKRL